MRILLISTYELGRQPFGLASPAAWLGEAGHDVSCVDLSRQRLDEARVRAAQLVACYLPMHTATRLAVPVVQRVRALNPSAHICAYGLYAPLNAAHLRVLGVDTILGGEFEADLLALANTALATGAPGDGVPASGTLLPETLPSERALPERPLPERLLPERLLSKTLPKLRFRVPDRSGLPPLAQYARLHIAGESRIVGYTEATRGCKHLCRHCPIVPIYSGHFRVVPVDVVLADIRQQVEAGARHITFGDPDFFNGPTHAMAIVSALAREWPGLTYDATIKVEHLLKQRDALPRLRDTGCLFVTSAVEAIDDTILTKLDKRHTRADVIGAVAACRAAQLTLVPTFVAFTPWTTLDGYFDLIRTVADLELVSNVPSIQWAIRLLIPDGSRLLELEDVRALIEPFDREALVYRWRHPDPRVDALQRAVEARIAGTRRGDREVVFREVLALAASAAAASTSASASMSLPAVPPMVRATVPYLDEPWYC